MLPSRTCEEIESVSVRFQIGISPLSFRLYVPFKTNNPDNGKVNMHLNKRDAKFEQECYKIVEQTM